MTPKTCTRCGESKSPELFRTNKKMRSGLDSWCKACVSSHKSAKRLEIKAAPKITPASKSCWACRETKASSLFAVERGRKDGLSAICRACRSARHYASYARDPEAWKAKALAANKRRSADPSFVVHKRVSARVREWLGTKRGGKRCFELLGYSLDELRAHLERQFVRGMSWQNIGSWHIDHIVPLASFAAATPDSPEFGRAWALTNLRPLWAKDNMRKHASREMLL